MKPTVWICLTCLLAGPLLANESADTKLEKARTALTGASKDADQAKKLLLDIVEHDKDTLDSQSLCYVYVYLGYIADRAGNRSEAIPWYQKALEITNADWVQECAAFGKNTPLVWIRHLDEGTGEMSLQSAPPVVVKTMPEAGTKDVAPGEMVIKIIFSKEMMDQSWSWSSAWQNSTPESIGRPYYEADRRTCVMKVKLEPGKTYGWWINSQSFNNFKDAQGHAAVPYLFVFQTKDK